MEITRHRTNAWIKNRMVDVSIKSLSAKEVDVHWHDFYEIELILEGAGSYHIDGIEYEIKRGALFCMCPASFHRLTLTKTARLINFMFIPDACDSDVLCDMFRLSPHLSMEISEEAVEFISALANEAVLTNSISYQTALLNCVLGKIRQLCVGISPLPPKDPIRYALLYIQNHFREDIRLAQAAKAANYSTNYFGNKFKEYTGLTFREYIANLRFSLAEELLEKTELSTTEICFACGFREYSNFMRHFKKRYKQTPNCFRKTQREKSPEL